MSTSVEPSAPADSDVTPRWFLLRTRSRQEVILSNELRAMGMNHCLLLVGRRRRFGAWEAAVRVPLLPQYLFLCGSALDAEFAARTNRVTELTEVPDGSRLAEELEAACRAVESGAPCELATLPDAPRAAEITSGPLAGLRGVLRRETRDPRGFGTTRILLPLTCTGSAIAVEVDASSVELSSTSLDA